MPQRLNTGYSSNFCPFYQQKYPVIHIHIYIQVSCAFTQWKVLNRKQNSFNLYNQFSKVGNRNLFGHYLHGFVVYSLVESLISILRHIQFLLIHGFRRSAFFEYVGALYVRENPQPTRLASLDQTNVHFLFGYFSCDLPKKDT